MHGQKDASVVYSPPPPPTESVNLTPTEVNKGMAMDEMTEDESKISTLTDLRTRLQKYRQQRAEIDKKIQTLEEAVQIVGQRL